MFHINLKKAHVVQGNIMEYINSERPATDLRISAFQHAEVKINDATEAWETYLKNTQRLLGIRRDIRSKIATVNAETGISQQLAEVAEKEALTTILRQQANPSVEKRDMREIAAILQKIEADESFAYPSEIRTSIFSRPAVEGAKKQMAELKKEVRDIKEELLVKNINHTIKLDDADAQFLDDLGLL